MRFEGHADRHSDLVVIVGDFNRFRPWKASVVAKFEECMHVYTAHVLFAHSVPCHMLVYAGKASVHLISLQRAAAAAPLGHKHDGVGDHDGILTDLL